ncbi:MAG: aspartate carbamoyltransferase catalytic subunit [Clostridia bacterium]|nr:aspartate carbamoyltransferase catalytic subunit [Clostridia bacterium]
MGIKVKDLISMSDLSVAEMKEILTNAKAMKEILKRDIKKVPTLRGRVIINLFYENSTRTRTSFELAGKYMGADVININVSTSSVAKGESLLDTAKTLDSMGADVVVMRHPASGAHHLLGQAVKARVINAGDGAHEHPTQALLDLYTMLEYKQDLQGRKVAIIGDILHSRVARSNILGLNAFGAQVWVCGPPTLMPARIEDLGVNVTYKMEEALADADVIMMLRIQLERQKKGLFPSIREYAKFYGLNKRKLALAKRDALVMHPGPMNRGVEITAEVAECCQAVIEEQVTNGVAVRMALLYSMGGVKTNVIA